MLTMDPLKRPTAFEALSHYWILNRFADIQADNLLMDEGTEEDENLEYEVLTAVQSNMANYKYNYLYIKLGINYFIENN